MPGGSTSAGYEETLLDVAARARDAEVLVAVAADGSLLGVTYVPGPGPYAEFSGADEAGIRMLAVSPAAQRLGVGRRLVVECIERAQAAGRARIVLHTTAAMTAAQLLDRRARLRSHPRARRPPIAPHAPDGLRARARPPRPARLAR